MKVPVHCVKSVQIRVFFGPYFPVFSPNAGKYGPKKTPYLDTCNDCVNEHKNHPIRKAIKAEGMEQLDSPTFCL